MNYSDLYRAYAHYTGISISEAQRRFSCISEFCYAILESGEDVYIPGLFRLYTKVEPPKKGHNPLTGESIIIPETIRVKCDLSKKIKEHFKSGDFKIERGE